MKTCQLVAALLAAVASVVAIAQASPAAAPEGPSPWPEATAEARPWAYWWWHGSAVDRENLRRELRRYREAGMGGVHIVPIYEVKGREDRSIEYLSPPWLEMLDFTVSEARRLGLGVDMTMGTGWCFGGPHISDRDANASVVCERPEVAPGQKPRTKIARADVQAAMAFGPEGARVDLIDRLDDHGTFDWSAPGDGWNVYVVAQKPSGRKVKRAAPGGAGWMLNPWSKRAFAAHAARFDEALDGYRGAMPRAFYHDSYEYQCDWSDELFDEFERRRGYRLQDELPALFGEGDADRVARVKGDYRHTVSDMMLESFTRNYVSWAHAQGCLARDQAHGSPANLLDLYGENDVPETEFFRFDRNPLVAKFASSAAHTRGRKLTSAETATWLAEHFHVTLGHLKPFIDGLFASGVNHVFYHGTCYSPDDVPWPGCLFYASTQMNPRNAIWRDAPALNAYIARCQSVLQAGTSDNDVLLYWPIHDLWHDADGLAKGMTVHHTGWIVDQPIGRTARWLWDHGYAFDYVSDRQLPIATIEAGRVVMPGGPYRAVLVPPCTRVPIETVAKLLEMAHAGATVLFEDGLPGDVPGLADLPDRREVLQKLLAERLGTHWEGAGVLRRAATGRGKVIAGPLSRIVEGLPREPVADRGTTLVVRRRLGDGRFYFIANQDEQFTHDPQTEPIDGWIPLGTQARGALAMDPMTGRFGRAAVRQREGVAEVYLQLAPCESIVLRTFDDREPDAPDWEYVKAAGEPVAIAGTWSVEFIEGGPELPAAFETGKLVSWTELGGEAVQRFAGTARYTIGFDAPAGKADRWLIDLGRVCQSARLRWNGRDLGTLLARPFRARVPPGTLKPSGNVLEIEVTNLSANRIRDLDRRGVPWKRFHDINIVNVDYQPFDASNWPIQDSGLIGPVTLVPAERIDPARRSASD